MINNPRTLRSLQLKMIIGYAVIISLFLLVLTFIYKERQKQVQTVAQTKELQQQRQLAENAAVQILDLALLGEKMLAWEEEEFALYAQKKDTLTTLLYRLREQLPDDTQRKRISAIIELLPLKEKYIFATLDDLQKLRNTYSILQKRIPTIIRANKKQQEKLTQEIRQNYEGDQKKTGGFLGLFRSTKKSRYLTERENHAALLNDQSQTDTRLRSLANEIDRTRMESTERLFTHLDSLSTQNTWLNRQMCCLITDFNQTSQDLQKQVADTYLQGKQQGLRAISGLGLCAVLLAFIFYLLLQKDLRKRHKIRMELEQSNQRNEELLHARKNIMLTVSHDLRAPLSTISGYAELTQDEQDHEKRNKYVDNILHSSRNMLYLVNSLLNFYRLDTGKEAAHPSTFHLKSFVDHLSAYFEPQTRKKNLRFETGYEGPDVFITGDKERLWEIISNLVSNAIKFTSAGEVKLLATYAENKLTVAVQDTGHGMTQEEVRRSFLAFERLDNAAGQKGFGLGLSITNSLVSLLKGTIEVQSIPDFGSRFTVCVPMPATDEKDFGLQELKRSLPVLPSLHILVIDDDPLQLGMVRDFFSGSHVRCNCCQNVKELFDYLQKDSYQLVLTDIQMEPVNGVGVLKLLRSSNIRQAQTIPVLAVTAHIDQPEGNYTNSGFCGTLSKPFSKEELFKAISTYAAVPVENSNRKADFSVLLSKENNREEMIGLFIKQTSIQIELLKNAREENDGRKVAGIIHKILPLWASIGTDLPAEELRELAKITSDGIPPDLREQVTNCIRTGETLLEEAILYRKRLNNKANENDTDHRG